jgi:2-dehydro-3-deoxygluconokinase
VSASIFDPDSMQENRPFDVVVMGEILVEVATDVAFGHGVPAQLGISGDALNVAAAAAAAGARTGLLAVLTDDDLGQAIATRIRELGISDELLTFRTGQQGVYLVHCDPDGQREFSYARSGSVGSTLGPDDVDPTVVSAAGAVIAGGIACAISASSRAAVLKAAALAGRPRRTGAADLPGHSVLSGRNVRTARLRLAEGGGGQAPQPRCFERRRDLRGGGNPA